MRSNASKLAVSMTLALSACWSSDDDEPIRPPISWAEVDAGLDRLAAATTMIAAEIADDGSLTPFHERSPDSLGAIGTAFKLYVLGIVTDRIAGGVLRWEDELTITAADKSLAPGQLQDRPDGSRVTVDQATMLMMSASDNTATDLLIDAVGRDQVEYILAAMGMSEESQRRTTPLLTTRERFSIVLGDPELRAKYADPAVNSQRLLLRVLPDDPPEASALDPNRPASIETIGWFASPVELARAQLWVDSQRGLPGLEPLEQIIAADSGIPLEAATWTKYSYAGAREPGVLSLSWLLQRADGRQFVVAIIANDAHRPVDEDSVEAIATGVIDLLAST